MAGCRAQQGVGRRDRQATVRALGSSAGEEVVSLNQGMTSVTSVDSMWRAGQEANR